MAAKKNQHAYFYHTTEMHKNKAYIGLTEMDTSHSDQPTQLYFKTNKFSTYSISCYM